MGPKPRQLRITRHMKKSVYLHCFLHLISLTSSSETCNKMSRAPSNPFYTGPASPPSSAGPPSYSASTRPVPPVPPQPVSYTSLSDLTRGKQQQPPPSNSFEYQPSSQRAGYRDEGFTSGGGGGGGGNRAGPSQAMQGQGGRRLPPDPSVNRDKSLLPPKRNVPRMSPSSLSKGLAMQELTDT